MSEPVEHLCDGTGVWELGVTCRLCPPRTSKRTRLPAPNFNIARLHLWNNYAGAGGVTNREYVEKMLADNRAMGKTEEQMPVPDKRWI